MIANKVNLQVFEKNEVVTMIKIDLFINNCFFDNNN